MYNRVVIKLSGEALGNSKSFDDEVIYDVIRQIKNITESGTQVALVIGGGNFWRGRSAHSAIDKVKSDQIGMLATVMNGLYLCDAFRQSNVPTKIMTPFAVGTMTEQFSKDLAIKYLSDNVLIFAGGTGHPFFSTDTIAALRAAELEADCVLYAKNIDGVYTADPNVFSDAQKYKAISYRKVIYDNLNAIDISAMSISWHIPSIVFALQHANSIIKACNTDEVFGTRIQEDIKEELYA